MPLFSIQIKNMSDTLIITISIVVVLYFAIAMAYATKIDNALRCKYSKMTSREYEKICFYTLFWFIFFIKLNKIIKGKEQFGTDFALTLGKHINLIYYETALTDTLINIL